jgi:hypothetical protein
VTTVDRYLRLLGIARRAPSPEALAELTPPSCCGFPSRTFPSSTIAAAGAMRGGRRTRPPPLHSVERDPLGGTCYALAFSFHLLLAELGYDVSSAPPTCRNPMSTL